jgi:hypothetical protein
MIDNLFNDMFNPAMLLSAGGITGLYIRHSRGERVLKENAVRGRTFEKAVRLI